MRTIAVLAVALTMAMPVAAEQAPALPIAGYAPTQPALQGNPQPGSTIVFQPSVSPSQAFPPPPPQAHYPPCQHGQHDECVQLNDPK